MMQEEWEIIKLSRQEMNLAEVIRRQCEQNQNIDTTIVVDRKMFSKLRMEAREEIKAKGRKYTGKSIELPSEKKDVWLLRKSYTLIALKWFTISKVWELNFIEVRIPIRDSTSHQVNGYETYYILTYVFTGSILYDPMKFIGNPCKLYFCIKDE